MSNQKKDTTENIPFARNTTEDQKNWPFIIDTLFHQALSSRLSIVSCIKSSQLMQPSPSNEIELKEALQALDDNDENWGINQQKMLADSNSFVPKDLSKSYRVIFEAIASMIIHQLMLRTFEKKDSELQVKYRPEDDNYGRELMAWGPYICDSAYPHIRCLIEETLPSRIKNFPIDAFLQHIECTVETKKDLLDSEMYEFPYEYFYSERDNLGPHKWPDIKHDAWIRFFVHPLEPGHFECPVYEEPKPLLLESAYESSKYHSGYLQTYYFRSRPSGAFTDNVYGWELLGDKTHAKLVSECIKLTRTLMDKMSHFCLKPKEMLFLVTILECFDCADDHNKPNFPFFQVLDGEHTLKHASLEEYKRPLSQADMQQLITQFPLFFHTLIVKNETRDLNFEEQRQRSQQIKTNIIIDNIHQRIARSPQLFKSYCKYLLKYASLGDIQRTFLHKYFDKAHAIAKKNTKDRNNLIVLSGSINLPHNPTLKPNKKEKIIHIVGKILSPRTKYAWKNQSFPSTNIKWIELGNGGFNAVYKSPDDRLVFKYIFNNEDDITLDHRERSVRVWNEINDDLPLPAVLQEATIDSDKVYGWVCPYIEGEQSEDIEMANALIRIFNKTGRIVVDATSHRNFITTPAGKAICVDVGYALALDKIDGLKRSVSHASLQGWEVFNSQSTLFADSYSTYPQTIDTLKALLFIKLKETHINNVNFLINADPTSLTLLRQAYDDMMNKHESEAVHDALEWIIFNNIKWECSVQWDGLTCAERNKMFNSWENTRKGVGYRALLGSIKDHSASINEIHDHIKRFFGEPTNRIPVDVKTRVEQWQRSIEGQMRHRVDVHQSIS